MTGKENDVDVDDTMFDLAKGVLLQDGSASMGQDPKKYHMNPYEKLLMRVYILCPKIWTVFRLLQGKI